MKKLLYFLTIMISISISAEANEKAISVVFRSNFQGESIGAYFDGKEVFSKKIKTDHSIGIADGFTLLVVKSGVLRICLKKSKECGEIILDPKKDTSIEVFLGGGKLSFRKNPKSRDLD